MGSLKMTSGFKSFWGKLTELLGPATTIIFFLAVAFGVMVMFVGDSQNLVQAQSNQSKDGGYYLDWLVSNELVFVKATRLDYIRRGGPYIAEADRYLAFGLKEVGKRFIIKKQTPILGATYGGGSCTISLILEVESR